MKVVLLCSATGGTGKTTACLRLAEQLAALRVPSAVVDLSPYPTTGGAPAGVTLVQGTAATSSVAVGALLRPHAEKCQVALLDGPPLGDAHLEAWLPHCTHLVILTRVDAFALNSLSGIWQPLDALRRRFPQLTFMGFLPTMVRAGDDRGLGVLRGAAKGFLLPTPIPHDDGEAIAAQREHFAGLDTLQLPASRALSAYRSNAEHLLAALGLTPVAPPAEQPSRATGLLTKAWQIAAGLLRNRDKAVTS